MKTRLFRCWPVSWLCRFGLTLSVPCTGWGIDLPQELAGGTTDGRMPAH